MNKFNPTKYKNEYAKEKYDRIIINVQRGEKTKIEAYGKTKGYKSLNSYINDLIQKDMSGGGYNQ